MKKKEIIKKVAPPKFQYETEWQDFLKLEGSLTKILRSPQNFSFTQQNFTRLIDAAKQLTSIIEMIKLQRKSYNTVLQQNRTIQAKLQNHNNIISAMEANYVDRIKTLGQQLKLSREQNQKIRKIYQDKIQSLEQEIKILKQQKYKFGKQIEDLKKESHIQKLQKQKMLLNFNNVEGKLNKAYKSSIAQRLPKPSSSSLSEMLTSQVNHKILAYLTPSQIKNITSLSKLIRLCILHSPKCLKQIFSNQQILHKKKVSHFKRHIRYFEKVCQKIPQQMVKVAFYKYMILKKQAGNFILPVLNSSAMLFQGKFVEVGFDFMYEDDGLYQYENTYSELQVDDDIRSMYKQQTQQNRDLITSEVQLMYHKIQNTAQLYSADVESIGLFLNNIQRNYSKLFVFGKLLYNQIKQLQLLNSFLLSITNDRQNFQLQKTSQIQDLKAELDSQRKIKNFFSTKSLHSEQRALALQNQKLNSQLKLKQLNQKYQQLQRILKNNKSQLQQTVQKNTLLVRDNRIFKQNFQSINSKHNNVMQQLQLLKEILIKMNLS